MRNAVIKDDYYNRIEEEFILCPLCALIFINPMMCIKCQNVICKECLDNYSKKFSKCPICKENLSNYKISIGTNKYINTLLFICKDCNKIIKYEECFTHKKACHIKKFSKKEIINIGKKPKLKNKYTLEKISYDEFKKLKNDNYVTKNIKSKYF